MIRLQQFAEVNKMYHRTAQLRDLFVYLIRPGKLCVLYQMNPFITEGLG